MSQIVEAGDLVAAGGVAFSVYLVVIFDFAYLVLSSFGSDGTLYPLLANHFFLVCYSLFYPI